MNSFSLKEKNQPCPILGTHRRLLESFMILEDLMKDYDNEARFTLSLNNLIQNLRNVTFILQKELAHADGFKEWYALEQEKMRGDRKLKWLHDSRNTIVKESDLNKSSFAKVSIKDHFDRTLAEGRINPSADSMTLAIEFLKRANLKVSEKLSFRLIVEVEKYWIVNNYTDSEVGELLIYCQEYIKNLVDRAHQKFFQLSIVECSDFPKLSLSGSNKETLENIFKSSRIVHLYHKDLQVLKKNLIKIDRSESSVNCAKNRYGDLSHLKEKYGSSVEELPFNKMELHKEMVRLLFDKDQFIVPVAFLYFPNAEPMIISFKFENPADRYLIFEEIANRIKETKCRAVVWVSEAWVGKMPNKGEVYIPPTEQKQKELVVIVAANPKETRNYFFEIIRKKFQKPVLKENIETKQENFIAFERIYRAWKEMDTNT